MGNRFAIPPLKGTTGLGVKILGLTVDEFSKHFSVTPLYLMKILPHLSNKITGFPTFLMGIHHGGPSHPDTEYLYNAALNHEILLTTEFKNKNWGGFRSDKREKLISELSYGERDQLFDELRISRHYFEKTVSQLAKKYTPPQIEEASIKWILNKFTEPTSWLYWSDRWEKEKTKMTYHGMKTLSIGPVTIPFPDFVQTLIPAQRSIFEAYTKIINQKSEINSDHHYRINALKTLKRKISVSGEKVVFFGYITNTPTKEKGDAQLATFSLCDSIFYPNDNHKIKVVLDTSEKSNYEEELQHFIKYQIMLLGTASNAHIRASAILKVTDLVKTLSEMKSPTKTEKLTTYLV